MEFAGFAASNSSLINIQNKTIPTAELVITLSALNARKTSVKVNLSDFKVDEVKAIFEDSAKDIKPHPRNDRI